jgi:hypothetical protein
LLDELHWWAPHRSHVTLSRLVTRREHAGVGGATQVQRLAVEVAALEHEHLPQPQPAVP